ncbi:MAG: mechanosensitive ion channel domain-containing protein [Synechococcales bacterium]|nr:mechanosensitive ion channel domain-containing protein [Synechococcales bacterium]
MNTILEILRNFSLNYAGIPIGKIIATIIVLTLIQAFRRFLVSGIVRSIERFTRKTQTKLDDELIMVLKPTLSWLILIGGIWVIKGLWAQELGSQFDQGIGNLLGYVITFIVAYFVYRCASIFGQIIANVILRTDTELDELLRPLMPKVFQATAVIFLAIKASEIFLGQSAAALVGLLGGAGITIGLLLKDIVYDWFCTLVIYSDNLYREGDWVAIVGLEGFVQVVKVGFRTTTLHVYQWGSIVKMPNSKMITGIVENWSQNPGEELKWGISLKLNIDNISAAKTNRICKEIETIIPSISGLSKECIVRFSQIENNARVIKVIAFVNDDNLYFGAERNLNLAILEILEQENIDFLTVKLETDPEKYKQRMSAVNN